jgi:predicted GNAT family N-acyltransferase
MPEKPNIQVNKITDPAQLEKVFAIRTTVFVDEQHCPPELERENEDVSNHFLANVNGEPAGACRWRQTDLGYKLERFAVLSKYRRFGLGQAMVKTVLADLPDDASYIYLNAQTPAVSLYLKFGFEKVGAEFEEAGIKHYKMVLKQGKV